MTRRQGRDRERPGVTIWHAGDRNDVSGWGVWF